MKKRDKNHAIVRDLVTGQVTRNWRHTVTCTFPSVKLQQIVVASEWRIHSQKKWNLPFLSTLDNVSEATSAPSHCVYSYHYRSTVSFLLHCPRIMIIFLLTLMISKQKGYAYMKMNQSENHLSPWHCLNRPISIHSVTTFTYFYI